MSDEQHDWLDDARIGVAKKLRRIVDLSADLHWQARAATNHKLFPGGQALNMMAGVTPSHDWQRVYDYLEYQGADDLDKYAAAQDESHPLTVLCYWTRMVREERDQPTKLEPTIGREVDYLLKSLDWMTRRDEFGEAEWFQITEVERDLQALIRRMENVLHAGNRSTMNRARCIYCDKAPRLAKRHGDAEDGSDDYWQCPNRPCSHLYDAQAVARARHHNLHGHGAERFVASDVARDVAGVDRRTWWSWGQRMKMRRASDIRTRQIIVWWPDVRDLVKAKETRVAKRTA